MSPLFPRSSTLACMARSTYGQNSLQWANCNTNHLFLVHWGLWDWFPRELLHPLTVQCHPQDHSQWLPALGSAAENPEFLHLFISKFQWNTELSKVTGQLIDQNDSTETVTCNNDQGTHRSRSQVRSSLLVLCFGTKMWSWVFPRTIT